MVAKKRQPKRKTQVDWSKPVESDEHDPRIGRIICTDAKGPYPVIMLFEEGDRGGEFPFRFTREGLCTCGTFRMINRYKVSSWWFFCRNVNNKDISQHGPYSTAKHALSEGKKFSKAKKLSLVGVKETLERVTDGEGLSSQ